MSHFSESIGRCKRRDLFARAAPRRDGAPARLMPGTSPSQRISESVRVRVTPSQIGGSEGVESPLTHTEAAAGRGARGAARRDSSSTPLRGRAGGGRAATGAGAGAGAKPWPRPAGRIRAVSPRRLAARSLPPVRRRRLGRGPARSGLDLTRKTGLRWARRRREPTRMRRSPAPSPGTAARSNRAGRGRLSGASPASEAGGFAQARRRFRRGPRRLARRCRRSLRRRNKGDA